MEYIRMKIIIIYMKYNIKYYRGGGIKIYKKNI
jgi:hypothetical protein